MTTHEASPCVRHHHYSVPTSNSDTIALSAVFGVNREQDVSVFDLALIAFRLVLWNTHADECSRKSSAAAPPAAPAKAAMIGPAAINTPSPGIANAPIPTIQPNAPPRTAPVPAPVAAPSGALVCCSWAKSLVPRLSGKSTETSFSVKPTAFKLSAIVMA